MQERQAFADNTGELHKTKLSALEADLKHAAVQVADEWFRHPSGQMRHPEQVLVDTCSNMEKFHQLFKALLTVQDFAFKVKHEEALTPEPRDIPDFE